MVARDAVRSVQHILHSERSAADAELLRTFVTHADESAFADIVRRHGPMVWGVCRRSLGDHHDAEDAFQATFLILARRAASIRPPEMLAGWLHGVARNVTAKARERLHRQRSRERPLSPEHEPGTREPKPADWSELLDEEVGRLPRRYREAVVLCGLSGRTEKEVAEQIGVPEGTLSSRLSRAKAMLAERLKRHGIPASAGVMLLLNDGSVCGSACGEASARARAWAGEIIRGMTMRKVKHLAAVVALLAVVGTGAVTAVRLAGADEADPKEKVAEVPKATPEQWRERALGDEASGPLNAVAFAPDGKTFATAGDDGQVRVWDARTLRRVKEYDATPSPVPVRSHDIRSLAYSPEGDMLAAGTESLGVRFWNLSSGVQDCFDCDTGAASVAFSSDGSRLIIGRGDGAAQIWEAGVDGRGTKKSHVRDINLGGEGVVPLPNAAACSPKSPLIAFAHSDSSVRIVNLKTGNRVYSIKPGKGGVKAVAFSSDRRTLAVAGSDEVSFWEFRTGKLIARTPGCRLGIALAFSPDGKSLAVGAIPEDKNHFAIRLIDPATGKIKRDLGGYSYEGVRSLAFSPDGKTLIAAGRNMLSARLIPASPPGKWLRVFTLGGPQVGTKTTLRGAWSKGPGTVGRLVIAEPPQPYIDEPITLELQLLNGRAEPLRLTNDATDAHLKVLDADGEAAPEGGVVINRTEPKLVVAVLPCGRTLGIPLETFPGAMLSKEPNSANLLINDTNYILKPGRYTVSGKYSVTKSKIRPMNVWLGSIALPPLTAT